MSRSKNISSTDKLILSAIDLFAEKGYKSVTTQEIATAAGLSEKTLFRHFGSKLKLLEAVFNRFHYTEDLTELFNEKLVWDLQTDLLLISRTYHKIMNRNRKLIMINFKEGGNIPEFCERTRDFSQQLMDCLTDYFTVAFEKGKIIRTNPKLQALSFMMTNYGVFMYMLDSDANFSSVSLEAFTVESVQTFTRALTP